MFDYGDDERCLAIAAFRYCLGRQTYMSLVGSQFIINNWKTFSTGEKELFKREIQSAIDVGMAGMDMDVREWQKVLKLED